MWSDSEVVEAGLRNPGRKRTLPFDSEESGNGVIGPEVEVGG